MQKIWVDRHFMKYFLDIALGGLLLLVLYADFGEMRADISKYLLTTTFIEYLAILLIIFFFINSARIKLTYITKEGIRIGNASDDMYDKFKLKQPHLYKWNEIKYVKIVGKEIRRPFHDDLINVLILRPKKAVKKECFIARPKGFVKVLNQLGKSYLLLKDSKFLD